MPVPLRRIVIEAVAQHTMRPPYDASEVAGDWYVNDAGELAIRATGADLDDAETLLLAIHELVEAVLCRVRGVSQAAVDAFDRAYDGEDEPGDAPGSPYRKEHRFACLVEFLLAHELGLAGYGTMR